MEKQLDPAFDRSQTSVAGELSALEDLVREWVLENLDSLELGGIGEVAELSARLAAWRNL